MNVYCSVCGSEMEIMLDLKSELRVYPCGCGGSGEQESQPTQRAADGALCPVCDFEQKLDEVCEEHGVYKITPRR